MKKIYMIVMMMCFLAACGIPRTDVCAAQKELPTINLNPSEAAGKAPAAPQDSATGADDGEGFLSGNTAWIVIAVLGTVTAVALTALSVVLIANRRRKRAEQETSQAHPQAVSLERDVRDAIGRDGRIYRQNAHMPHNTIALWQDTIRLTDEENLERVFVIPFDSMKDTASAVVGSASVAAGSAGGAAGVKGVDIRIADDRTVSGRHCRFIKKGRMYYVEDLNSTNGTKINGNKIYAETPILSGDTIKIGKHLYRVTINQSR